MKLNAGNCILLVNKKSNISRRLTTYNFLLTVTFIYLDSYIDNGKIKENNNKFQTLYKLYIDFAIYKTYSGITGLHIIGTILTIDHSFVSNLTRHINEKIIIQFTIILNKIIMLPGSIISSMSKCDAQFCK